MQITILYNIFIRDFRKQKKRIALTLIALAWGTISIMLLLGFGEGLHQQLTLNKKGMGENIMVIWAGQTAKAYKGMGVGRPIRFFPEDIEYLKKTVPELIEVGGEYDRWGVRVERGDRVFSEHVNGVTPNYENIRNFIPQSGGRMINDLDMKNRRRVAFIGWELKERLFDEGEDPIGQKINLNSVPYIVVGIMKEKLSMGNYNGMDFDRLVIPLTTFKATFGDPYLDNIVCQLAKGEDSEAIETKIFETMGAKYKFDPTDDRHFRSGIRYQMR